MFAAYDVEDVELSPRSTLNHRIVRHITDVVLRSVIAHRYTRR